jgi:hypothetical protein
MSKWMYLGDANMLDYGGKNYRHVGKQQYQFVELINMDEACGRDNEGQSKYVVELRLVDLDAVSDSTVKSALECCGMENQDLSNITIAECCDSYGAHAPLGSWSGNNARKIMREAYKLANELLDDSALEEQLEKPVNKIGSTALEFMQGDTMSAIQRGCESGNTDARIIAKMHGNSQETIDNTRPADFLPYVMGYMCAMNNGQKETDPDTSPEYFRGFDRALAVKEGKCPAPNWIQTVA